MTIEKRLHRFLALAMAIALWAAPLLAQRRADAPPAPKEAPRAQADVPALDNLLAADDYKVFGEIKNVGQLIRSPNVAEILDPLIKLANPPKEFKSLVKFANTHAELLQTSRLFFATWPAKRKIPEALFVIEFSSADEAQKFEPQLREFLPKIMPPPEEPAEKEAVPAGRSAPTVEADAALPKADSQKQAANDPKPKNNNEAPGNAATASTAVAKQAGAAKPAPLPFAIKQLGNLVLVSDTPVNLKNLRPANSELLFDNPNFRQAHDRFGSEQIFVFVNIALDERKQMVPEGAELTQQGGRPQKVVVDGPTTLRDPEPAVADTLVVEGQPKPMTVAPTRVKTDATNEEDQVVDEVALTASMSAPEAGTGAGPDMNFNFGVMMGSLFGGTPKWPDAVGVAIAFEGDSYVARVLLVGGPDGRASPVPFISQWVSGPALALESPSILPADTELFVAASLDVPQIYEGMAKTIAEQTASYQRTSGQPHNEAPPEPPFAFLEKKLGLKFKEDLFPVLGNEIAVTVPVNTFTGTPSTPPAPATGEGKDSAASKPPEPSPVILISVKDKEAARALLPKIIEGLGFKGAAMMAQKERRDDTEIISYAGVFSYAFVANFLVLSLNAAATRHVVDSYLAHQTLASDSHFRNSTRWQPRQLLGQVYLSPALMDGLRKQTNSPTALVSDAVREFMTRLSPVSEPVTYSLSGDGLGPMHELHVPKNLILMMVAGISSETNQSPLMRNEQMTRFAMMMIAQSEKTYRQNQGKGHYASIEQLADQQLVSKDLFRDHGYRIDLMINGDKFTATAVPIEYGKTGKLSYFVDETGIIRGADHGGAPATVADEIVQ